MTLGLIASCILFIIYFLGGYLEDKKICANLIIGLVASFVVWLSFSSLSYIVINNIFHINKTYVYKETTYDIIASKIEISKNNYAQLTYTNSDGITKTISASEIKIIEDDKHNYITVYKNRSKFRFITHFLDNTTYEYHGNVKDLYK